jgi:hypothetical protein
MVTDRTRARRYRRFGGTASEAPVIDVGHVLGPLAGGEVSVFLETRQPVARTLLPDHQENRLFLADAEPAAGPKILAYH